MTTTIIDKQSELKTLAKAIFGGVVCEDDLAKVDPKEVIAIKSDTSEPRRRFEVFEKAMKGDGDRVRRFVASTERADRTGDIVRVKGWDFTDFKKNPMAVWCHNTRDLPLGTVGLFEKATKEDPPKLYESIDFHTAELNPFADQVMRLQDAGGLRAVSVSFLPLPGGVRIPQTPEERDAMGLGPWGVEYTKQAQLELSVCVVPAHPDALATKALVEKALGDMVQRKELTAAQAKQLLEATEEPKVFAVAHAGESGDDAPGHGDEGAAKTSPIDESTERLVGALEKAVTALEATVESNVALRTRMDALERQIGDLIKTKADGSPVAPVKQEPEADIRARASAFFQEALEGFAHHT